jgi:hypothetical protein
VHSFVFCLTECIRKQDYSVGCNLNTIVTAQVAPQKWKKLLKKCLEIKKSSYLCAVKEMIYIRRSEYEQLLSQQEELVRQLRAETEWFLPFLQKRKQLR